MQSTDDFYRKLIKPIRDDYVSKIISSIESIDYSPYDQELNWRERAMPIKQLKEKFIEWSGPLIKGLDQFPFMYIMNGNTDSLNLLFNTVDNIAWKKGDYSYYKHWHEATGKSYQELDEPRSVSDLLVSWPGYSLGDNTELDFGLKCNASRLHLDCAYLGLVEPKEIDVSIFETASFSFSKTLAVPYNRISILFSKKELASVSLLNKLGYVNLSGVKIVNQLLKHIPVSYWWDNYGGDRLKNLCASNNLTASKCILFAYDKEKRIGLAPYWNTNG